MEYCRQVYKSISLTKVDTSVDGKYGTFCLVYKFHCNLWDKGLDNSDKMQTHMINKHEQTLNS